MISTIISVPILSVLLIFQSAILSRIPLLGGTADLILLAIVAWALQKRVQNAWYWGIIGGLLVGYVSALPFFVPLISYCIAVGLALLLRSRVWQMPILAMFVTVFFATLASNSISLISLRILGTSLPLLQVLNLITIPSLVLNLFLAIPFYTLLGDLASWLYPEELVM